ncbi:DHHC palmitoyltransferase-domain-containing protein [Hygrophoropsis aurantiaca]|uniref:DHHC palmitoyltransferase-domain-containing protein n=1 Tax=Hygrophoropsis aurantiaca TaxID=72124 RepID=A0ACB8A662_9AGAM|nr:DHHC palmitoyltransferase-domain-containing protein [Hygrophoropsis aurantiaca]
MAAASPTSLSFSASTPSLSTPQKKSRPAQLPLPSSNLSVAPVQQFQDRNLSSGFGASSGQVLGIHTRSISTFGHDRLNASAHRDYPLSSPATVTAFQLPPIPISNHVGGIPPSASYFRPSRPNHSRPSSLSIIPNDIISITANPAPSDQFVLAPLTRQTSHESDFGSVTGPGLERIPNLKRLKQSREPLLPLHARSLTASHAAPRPSMHSSPSQRSTTNASRRVRNSIEKVFRRGLSFDSMRKSTSSPGFTGSARLSSAEEHEAISPADDMPLPRSKSSSPRPRGGRPLHLATSQSFSATHHHTFISEPPTAHPPLSLTPVSPPRRIYRQYPSRNRFFCGGRLLTGGDSPWAFIASVLVVLSITGVWFGTTCVWWWHHESPAVAAVGAYMCLLTVSCMFTTAFRDPGILPRNLDPDPPLPATSPSDGGVRAPLPRDLKVRSDTVRVKYCPTCRTYRPPRSSHCKMCDNCVDGCDHHCQWINNCVGRRNYTSFFAFLFSAVLTLALVICTSAIHLYILTRDNHVDFAGALSQGVGSAVAFSLSVVVIWPVTALLAYHMRLLLLNVTTIEQIRNQAHKTLVPGPPPPNPFSYGSWRHNLAEVLCRPAGFSWIDAHGLVTEDKRRINPGLEDAGMGWEGGDLERAAEP